MPFITAQAEPLIGAVLLQMDWSDKPAVAYARIQRQTPDGVLTSVRMNTSTDATGEYIELSAGRAIIFDTEAPLDIPLLYITDGLGDAVSSAASGEVILQGSGILFLKDPVYPAHDIRIGLEVPSYALPECKPGDGIFFRTMGDENLGTQSTNWSIANSSYPVTLAQVRSAPASTLSLILRTFGDGDVTDLLMSEGTALLLLSPPKYGYSRRYISVGDYTKSRLSRDLRRQWQIATLPYVTVLRPAGLAYGILGARWSDLCSGPYATLGAAEDAGLLWSQIMLGQAGGPPAVIGYRTYAEVLSVFGTYTGVSNGQSYEQLLEG